jgi:thiamine-monophosphate kinase
VAIPEFELIRQYFSQIWQQAPVPELCLGPGDDAAIMQISPGDQLLVSVDTLNADVHFLADSPAERLAQRCLRVNISDLAAMGGEPIGFTLALSLPKVDAEWVASFSEGLAAAAKAANCPLIGGDTTRGPLSITIQVLGKVPSGQAIRRDGARTGDLIYVTGSLGDAAAALLVMQSDNTDAGVESEQGTGALADDTVASLLQAFYEPAMRISAGMALRGVASAGLDLSDGLVSDLQHVLSASSASSGESLGAQINVSRLPLSSAFRQACPSKMQQRLLAVSGGDDYQLCVTVPAEKTQLAERLMRDLSVPFACIGRVIIGDGIQFEDEQGEAVLLNARGYQHFALADQS